MITIYGHITSILLSPCGPVGRSPRQQHQPHGASPKRVERTGRKKGGDRDCKDEDNRGGLGEPIGPLLSWLDWILVDAELGGGADLPLTPEPQRPTAREEAPKII